MSYVSPIKIGYEEEPEEGWTDKIGRYIAGEVDNLVLQSCVKVGCHVDKDELGKALRYDRDQYVKGYEDGKRDAAAAIEALQAQLPKRGEIVRCGECKYRNDLAPTKWHPCVDMAVDDDWFCADGEREVQE